MTLLWCAISFAYLFPYTWMVLTGDPPPGGYVCTMPPRFVFTPSPSPGFADHLPARSTSRDYLLQQHRRVRACPRLLVLLVAAVRPPMRMTQLRDARAGTFLGRHTRRAHGARRFHPGADLPRRVPRWACWTPTAGADRASTRPSTCPSPSGCCAASSATSRARCGKAAIIDGCTEFAGVPARDPAA